MSDRSVARIKAALSRYRPRFRKMRDAIDGRPTIKDAGDRYLPKPPALLSKDVDPDGKKYKFLLSFAEFPEFTQTFLAGIQGLIHRKPPVIELPAKMEYLIESATPDGKSLQKLWEDLTREIFIVGRHGLLPEVYKDEVYLCQYHAESIINWRAFKGASGVKPSLVVLEEMHDETEISNIFDDREIRYYRVLRLDPASGDYIEELYREENKIASNDTAATLEVMPVRLTESDQEYPIRPSVMGKKFEGIPFVMVNAINLELEIGPIPLEPIADKALDIYRKSAAYNRALHNKSDPNIIRTGVTVDEGKSNTLIGGVIWDFANPDATVEYLDLDGSAIPYQRDAIEDSFEEARAAAGRLIDSQSKARESAEALQQRSVSQQVTTVSVINNAAQGLEQALKRIAGVLSVNPDEVKFEANLDFSVPVMTGKDANDLMEAKAKGAPISIPTIHNMFRSGGLTKKTFDEEQEEILQEDPLDLLGFRDMKGDVDDDNDDLGETDPDGNPLDPDEDPDDLDGDTTANRGRSIGANRRASRRSGRRSARRQQRDTDDD